MLRRTFLTTTLAAAVAAASVPATAQEADVVAVAQNNEDLSTLVTALQAAELVEPLQGDGPFTVFAPSNAAFEALPEGTLETLLMEENKEQLASILTYHVAPHRALAARLDDGMMGDTLNGGRVKVSNDGTVVMFGEATVVQADLVADNGVVHVIDTVLIPD